MNYLRKTCATLVCACAAAAASADSVDSHLVYHNDVFYHSIVVQETSHLTVWTDSYLDGGNLDPILAVWRNGERLGENDDNPSIAPGQTMYDSGLRLHDLMPGTYLFTVTMYDNFSNSTSIADGWRYDNDAPIALADMGIGPYISVRWTVTPVPEPSTWAMLAAGALTVGAFVRRRRAA
ncbi:putative secreted protein with PEP-CTERM sorting signal [Pseudoduganella flava]|uniref:PEP-CTERM sorting domain-containing protein n=1 Tax=Pseudoduganella flava TaxID=871742 RepID=A0A562PIJ4_9BURK|nr:DVUA0089 family protein [Pseudoduganella flava]QGZ41890.1 PEP-CTERM sorting domain-containing protein [Pseudoduganella flava]TWI44295.1 putative secreted protein with PEP-CTERM sorting signal [Pseudoduganella flava]